MKWNNTNLYTRHGEVWNFKFHFNRRIALWFLCKHQNSVTYDNNDMCKRNKYYNTPFRKVRHFGCRASFSCMWHIKLKPTSLSRKRGIITKVTYFPEGCIKPKYAKKTPSKIWIWSVWKLWIYNISNEIQHAKV
jgi:hypothetical protein